MATKYIDITGLLSTDGYVMCNKELIRLYGTDCAVLVGELCAEYKYFQTRETLTDGMFYSTQDNIEANTGLSPHCQREALKVLKEAGIVEVEKRGMPAKNFFRINEAQLLKIFTTSPSKPERQVPQELHLNNNNDKNNKKGSYSAVASDKSDYDSHSYSPEELKADFLGSGKKHTKADRRSLYDKCVDEIHAYTKNVGLYSALLEYLPIRLAITDKPIYGVNQWKGILNKLSELDGDPIKIVRQSIEKGWCSFYPLKAWGSSAPEEEGVSCNSSGSTEEERKDNLRRSGRRANF